MAPEQVALVGEYADVLEVGTRKMQNIPLLHPVGVSGKPVLLRRGTMSTLEGLLLLAAKYIMTRGNRRVIFCDVGSGLLDLHEKHARYQYSASTFRTDPPAMLVDRSHTTGRRSLVRPVWSAAVAAGARGLIVEVHLDPEAALSDGPKSLTFEDSDELMRSLSQAAEATGRYIGNDGR